MDLYNGEGVLLRLLPLLPLFVMKIDQLGITDVAAVIISMSPVSAMGTFDLFHATKVNTEEVHPT